MCLQNPELSLILPAFTLVSFQAAVWGFLRGFSWLLFSRPYSTRSFLCPKI